MNHWRSFYPDELFNADGIIDPSAWLHAKRRVLFLLRETNKLTADDLCQAIRSGCLPKTLWRRAGLWSYALQETSNERMADYKRAVLGNQWHESLCSSAVMNLKKTAGESSSDMSKIRKWAICDGDGRNRKLLVRQLLDCIRPSVVVCCGVGMLDLASAVFGLCEPRESNRRWKEERNMLWIDYYHPTARQKGFTNEKSFGDLSKILREASYYPAKSRS